MQTDISLPSDVSALSQINPAPVLPSSFCNIHPVFWTHLMQMVSFQASQSKIPFALPFSPYVPHAQPISPSSINHSDNIKLAIQIVKRRTVQLSPVPCHFLNLTPKYLHQYAIPFEYVLTSGQFISAILRTVFMQVKARKVKGLFKIQTVGAHGVTLQRRTALKLLPTASHCNAVLPSSC
jgi:hypothetical protein